MDRLNQFVRLAKHARKHVHDLIPIVKFNSWSLCRQKDMGGACGVASMHLLNLANKRGFNPTFVSGFFAGPKNIISKSGGHCWIEYDGHIIDVTATQFCRSYNQIHVVRNDNKRYQGNFRTRDLTKAINNHLTWTSYPEILARLA